MKCPRVLQHATGAVLDTNILIYLFEDHPQYGKLAEFVIAQAAAGVFAAVITPITVAELLVKPLAEGRSDVASRYRSALRHLRNITLTELSADTASMAAALRATYKLPLPDMFQAAACLRAPTPLLLTNDHTLARVREIKVLPLNAFA
ncbi:MAG: type II toxin-antitoxin system VapC family toxin [Lentisphaerae bacterium]|nr:type II toxin-antitoxin system VapC family toxin [Lentisphaerota bacterium]